MLMARPSPETLYTTVSVAPGVAGPVGPVVDGELGSVGSGKTGMVGRGVVVGVGRDDVGSGTDGSGATTVSCFELFTITSAMTSPITVRIARPATIHSQRGDFGPSGSGGCGGPPGGYWPPYCPVACGSSPNGGYPSRSGGAGAAGAG